MLIGAIPRHTHHVFNPEHIFYSTRFSILQILQRLLNTSQSSKHYLIRMSFEVALLQAARRVSKESHGELFVARLFACLFLPWIGICANLCICVAPTVVRDFSAVEGISLYSFPGKISVILPVL